MDDRKKTRRVAVFCALSASLMMPFMILYMIFVMKFKVNAAIFGGLIMLVFVYIFSAMIYFWKGPIK